MSGETARVLQKRDSQSNAQVRKVTRPSDALAHGYNPLEDITCRIGDNTCTAKHVRVIQRIGLFHPMNEGQKMQCLTRLQQRYGNRFVQRVVAQHAIQARLQIGPPGDIYEQEADRVAEQVTRMPEPQIQQQSEEEEEKPIQFKPLPRITANDEVNGAAPEVTSYVQSQIDSLRSGGGEPLPESVQGFFEPRFGISLNQVRVHRDSRAAEAAQAVNARAFTVGRDVVFGAGQYSPETATGRRLLAHELTHAIQQKGMMSNVPLNSQGVIRRRTPPPAKPEGGSCKGTFLLLSGEEGSVNFYVVGKQHYLQAGKTEVSDKKARKVGARYTAGAELDPMDCGKLEFVQNIQSHRVVLFKDGSKLEMKTPWCLDTSDPYPTFPLDLGEMGKGKLKTVYTTDSPGQGTAGVDGFIDTLSVEDTFKLFLMLKHKKTRATIGLAPWNWKGKVVTTNKKDTKAPLKLESGEVQAPDGAKSAENPKFSPNIKDEKFKVVGKGETLASVFEKLFSK